MTNTCPSATRMPAAVSAAPDTDPPQPRLLLLDDDPYMLGIQVRMLRDLGYAVVGTFASAPEALAYVMTNPDAVDVIFCDVNMPGMDGVEFLQGLCHTPFCGNIILLSGASLRIMHTIQRLLAGARFAILGSLQKPASRAAVRALLDCWEPPAPERAPQPLAEYRLPTLLVRGRVAAVGAALPAQGRPRQRPADRRRGAGALAASGTRTGLSRPFHRPGRGLRRRRCADGLGAGDGTAAAGSLARAGVRPAYRGQPLDGQPARAGLCPARGRTRQGRLPATAVRHAGDHRKPPDVTVTGAAGRTCCACG